MTGYRPLAIDTGASTGIGYEPANFASLACKCEAVEAALATGAS